MTKRFGHVSTWLLLSCVACGGSTSDADSGKAAGGIGGSVGGSTGSSTTSGGSGGAAAGSKAASGTGGSATSGSAHGGSTGSNTTSSGAGGSGGSLDIAPADCKPDPKDFTACGGDVVGKWRLVSICAPSSVDELRKSLMCPEADAKNDDKYRLRLEFNDGDATTSTVQVDTKQTATVPKSCLRGDQKDCSSLGKEDSDASDGSTLAITSSGDNCIMVSTLHQLLVDPGTWEAASGMITVTDVTGPTVSEYCVDHDMLTTRTKNDQDSAYVYSVFVRE